MCKPFVKLVHAEKVDGFERQMIMIRTVFLQVYLPATELTAVASSSSIWEVTVGPGFSVGTLNIYSAFGTANLNAFNLTAGQVNVASSG